VAAIQIAPAQTVAPQIKVYAPIDINRDIVCNEPLDAGDIRLLAASSSRRVLHI